MDEMSLPRLPSYVKLRFDNTRDRWMLLAPERVLLPDEVALDVIRRCTGERTLAAIIDDLCVSYGAERTVVAEDVKNLLQDLLEKRLLEQ